MTRFGIQVAGLFDGLDVARTEPVTVVVEEAQIVDIIEGHIVVSAADQHLSNAFLTPGLVDAHTHLVWAGDGIPHQWVEQHRPERVVLRMARAARANLHAGITTVRDLGATDGLTIPLAHAIADGDIPGPRVVAAGRAIAMTGGHAHQITREADGADAVRAAVRTEIKAGAACIKVMASGGVYDERGALDEPQLTFAELSAAVEETHKAGLKIAAHAYTPGPINLALDAGVDSIEHGSFLDETTAERMREEQVVFVPTLTASELIVRNASTAGTPAHMIAKAIEVRNAVRGAVRIARRVGTPIAGGSDAGGAGIPHGSFHLEVALFVQAGFAPAEAVSLCTGRSAQLLGLGGQVGAIVPGLAADLVAFHSVDAMRGDLSRPLAVFQAGRTVVSRRLQLSRTGYASGG